MDKLKYNNHLIISENSEHQQDAIKNWAIVDLVGFII